MDMFAHWMRKPLNKSTLEMHFLKRFWMDNWKEKEGYQSSHTMLRRNILSAGLSDNQLQIYHNYILVRNIKIYKWYHKCISIYAFEYGDEVEDLLPSDVFEKCTLWFNMWGLITDNFFGIL